MADLPCLVLFTKPARPGRVKTRLVGGVVGRRRLDAGDAAAVHAALLGDLAEKLATGVGRLFHLRVAWDLAAGEDLPTPPEELAGRPGVDVVRQEGRNLGERMFRALEVAAAEFPVVAVIGSDHPTVRLASIGRALDALAAGTADVALGPSEDGGYHLLGVRREKLARRLFEEVEWSSARVLTETRERCRELGARVFELPVVRDVDRGADVTALAADLSIASPAECPRTRRLLATWGLPTEADAGDRGGEEVRSCAS